MPRPLNWIRGEGTMKAQRGLGQDDMDYDPSNPNNSPAALATLQSVEANMMAGGGTVNFSTGTSSSLVPLALLGGGVILVIMIGKKR